MLFTPRQLTASEISSLQAEFLSLSTDQMQAAWNEMHEFFRSASSKEDQIYRDTFFYWYTDITWKLLNTLDKDAFLVAVPRQIPVALAFDYDVLRSICWYLLGRIVEPNEMTSFFSKLKQNIFASPAVLGQWQGKNVTVAEVVKETIALSQSGDDSLKSAEFLAKLKSILSNKEDVEKGFTIASADQMVDRFDTMVQFFIGVAPEKAYYLIDAMFHPERYEKREPGAETKGEEPQSDVPAVDRVPEEDSQKMDNTAPPTLAEIKNLVDSEFSKDETGQYADIEAVFGLLDQIAEEYNDEKIKEYFYFDENVGGFVWLEPSN
jgi:hypothetical protein